MELKTITSIVLTTAMMVGVVHANPTADALKRSNVMGVEPKYHDIIKADSLRDSVYACAYLGYERDSTVAVHLLSDVEQWTELEKQARRCLCYMEFINTTYEKQVPKEVLNESTLKELIASTLFVEVEDNRIFREFRSTQYFPERNKHIIAYNTSRQCGKNYVSIYAK